MTMRSLKKSIHLRKVINVVQVLVEEGTGV